MSNISILRKLAFASISAVAVTAVAVTAVPTTALSASDVIVLAQGKGKGHDSGAGHAGKQTGQGQGAQKATGGKGGPSLRDVFHDLEAADHDHPAGHPSKAPGVSGKKGSKKGSDVASKGQQKGKKSTDVVSKADDDSDRPPWAGVPGKEGKPGRPSTTSGTKKGDLYGDMYVILRDENGVPVLIQLADGTWVVQPVDAEGNLIPLDVEGHPVDETLTVEVELGRMNVGRAPLRVLSVRYEEALKAINEADTVAIDVAGRLELTTDGVVKTIDAPLENLAIYIELLNTGTLTGVIDTSKFTGELANLVDGQLTVDDFVEAASFLAAASDKTGSITTDEVVYMNSILGITPTQDFTVIGAPPVGEADATYVDLSTFNYDRSTVYAGVTVEVLVLEGGVWVPKVVDIYETVFNSTSYTSDDGGVDGFAQAADDARAVIEFIHEFSVPETAS